MPTEPAHPIKHLCDILAAWPHEPSLSDWKALALACEAVAVLAMGHAFATPCPGVGPAARPCVLAAGHAGDHRDAGGKSFGD